MARLAPAAALATCLAFALAPAAPLCHAQDHTGSISVVDDAGGTVRMTAPAQRIVCLSPGIAELLFSLGAGPRIVGVSEYSDFPRQARDLPHVSRAQGIDLERIASLHPDLIVTWGSGYSPALQDALRSLGVPVFVYEARSLETIASALERLGALVGAREAPAVAAQFRARRDELQRKYAQRRSVRAFYQVWSNPVMTLSGGHLTSELLRTCGATNIFAPLAPLVATVDAEAVVAAKPQIMIAAEAGAVDHGALDGWRRFPAIPAVATGMLVTLDADEIDRASTRVLDATQTLCERIEDARQKY
jgi:iron complex transport system substrate-binding protein